MPKSIIKKIVGIAKKVAPAGQTRVSGRGGKRPGAGRPKGSGKYGCPTQAVRIPIHLKDEVIAFVMAKIEAEK